MTLDYLKVKTYRNIEEADIRFSKGVNLLLGENAQGKTNALEAIYTFARGKSFRASKDSELVMFGKSGYETRIGFTCRGGRQETLAVCYRDKEKIRERNGIPTEKQAEMLGHFRAVLFCPEHLGMVKDGPDERRQFLNVAIAQCYPAYLSVYAEYNKYLAERNALLKFRQKGMYFDTGELEAWSAGLARCAAEIYRYRVDYMKRLTPYAEGIHRELSVGREHLKVGLLCDLREECDRRTAEQEYLRLFTEHTDKETQAGYTLYGVHRDDLSLLINDKSARDYGSQGQQRTTVLTLKLAEGEVCKDVVGESPVYLFDDVLSELDEGRRRVVIMGTEERQYILTACDKSAYHGECHCIMTEGGKYVPAHR